jgi:peptidoglycan/LPS O-acetylase OafA/YrhL
LENEAEAMTGRCVEGEPKQGDPHAPVSSSGQSIASVQALRGIAALAVVTWHASRYLVPYGSDSSQRYFLPLGSMGVDLFFILSGFIMVYTTSSVDGVKGAWSFLCRRFLRIWPLYAAITVAFLAYRSMRGINFYPFGDIWRDLLFLPHRNMEGTGFEFPVIAAGWTLNYEVYFYIVFGLSLMFGRGRLPFLCAWFAGFLILVPWLMGGFQIHPVFYKYNISYMNLVCDPLNWLFLSGVLIGYIDRCGWKVSNNVICSVMISLGLVGLVLQYINHYQPYHGLLTWGISLFPLVLLAVLFRNGVQSLIPSYLVKLGDWSFSLYLTHGFCQDALLLFVRTYLGEKYASGLPYFTANMLFPICIAWFVYKYLENPFHSWAKCRLKGPIKPRSL